MRLKSCAALILLAACTQAAAGDLYTAINSLRAGGATCASAVGLPPLAVRPELERAAAAIAQGSAPAASIEQTGYRATRSSYITIGGGNSEDERLLRLQGQYCAELLDPAMTDIGIYHDARRLLVIFAAPFAPAVADTPEAAGRKILALVNNARAIPRKCGDKSFKAAGPLRWNSTLAQAARAHADDMAHYSYFSHEGRDGATPAQRVARTGYKFRAAGENIAAGQSTPEDAVAGWLKSPPHCANLMNAVFTEMGSAFTVSKASKLGVYWVQVFGTPR